MIAVEFPHYFRVHLNHMKNITFSAEDELIDLARQTARQHHTTLNEAFRAWLETYARPNDAVEAYEKLKKSLSYVKAGRKFTREEMNER
jgi:hypothetical protein